MRNRFRHPACRDISTSLYVRRSRHPASRDIGTSLYVRRSRHPASRDIGTSLYVRRSRHPASRDISTSLYVRGGIVRIIRLLFFFIILLLGLSFAVLNAESVKLDYYFGSWQAPLSLLLAMVMTLGVVLGTLACMGMLLRLKRELSKLRKSAQLAQEEITNLRALPLKGTE